MPAPSDPPPPTNQLPAHPAGGRRPLVEPTSARLDRADADALLAAAGRGDLEAFVAFYDRTVSVVFGMLCAVLGPRAEHATEQVYLQLWRAAPGFDSAGRSAYATLLFATRRAVTGRVHDLLPGSAVPAPPEPVETRATDEGPAASSGDGRR